MSAGPRDVTGLLRGEVEALMVELGHAAYRGRQLFQWVQARRVTDITVMTTLSRDLRAMLAERILVSRPEVAREQRATDGTRKFLFRLGDGEEVESVLIPDEERLTACISTQVGCPLACRFCVTGLMGMRRNLTSGEIVGEILALQDRLAGAERISNIVLMGMGEPLLNFHEVERALRILCDEHGANFSPRRITLSTAGHVPGIQKLAASDLGVNLAVSLSATTDEVRDRLMPINKRWPIAELLKACHAYPLPQRRRLTFEYVMLDGVNDSAEDARRLVRLLRGIRCKINLIPFNATRDLPDRPSPRERIETFQQLLCDAKLTATIRESRGQDISAACGMLRTEQERSQTAKTPPGHIITGAGLGSEFVRDSGGATERAEKAEEPNREGGA